MGDRVDDEVGRLVQTERERERAQEAIVRAARRDRLGGRLAGVWVEDDPGVLVIAVTADAEQVERVLRAVADTPLRVVSSRYSLSELEAIVEAVIERAERLGAPLAAVGVHETDNHVDVLLEDLTPAASRALREHFAGQPVTWQQGTVVAG